MRERKYNLDEQSSFAKNHSLLGSKALMTDFDNIQIINTENCVYNQYKFIESKTILHRIIEVKYTPTDYIRRQLLKQDKPNSQILAFTSLINELNSYRENTSLPKAEFYYVVQTKGQYPYYVFNVTSELGNINYDYIGSVEDNVQYIDAFKF